MPKRLTRLKINEVSAVDRGAGERVEIVLLKRDAHFTPADQIVSKAAWEVLDAEGKVVGSYRKKKKAKKARDRINAARRRGRSLEKAIAEIDETKRLAKSQAAVMGESTMYTEIQKAAAVAVVKRFQDRVEEVARADRISFGAAMNKIAATSSLVNSEDAQLWADYRQASEIAKADPVAPAPAPAPAPTVSDAYAQMMHKAEKRAAKNGTTAAVEFSKIYQARPDLAQADKQFFFDKAAGGAQVASRETLIQAIMEMLGCDRAHASGVILEMKAKAPPVPATRTNYIRPSNAA